MKKELIILSAAALLSLNSCGLYKTYTPETQVPEQLYRETSIPTDTTSLANMHWSELFTDSYLQALIEEGLTNNTDMQTARLRVEQSEASLLSAKLAYLPSLNLAPQGTISSFDGSKAAKSYQLAAAASWEIDAFGKITNAKRGAEAALDQTRAYEQAVRTQLIATIANSYYSLLLLDKQLAVSQETARLWQENVKTMKALKQAGLQNEAGVSQAEANYLSVETSIRTLQKSINQIGRAHV